MPIFKKPYTNEARAIDNQVMRRRCFQKVKRREVDRCRCEETTIESAFSPSLESTTIHACDQVIFRSSGTNWPSDGVTEAKATFRWRYFAERAHAHRAKGRQTFSETSTKAPTNRSRQTHCDWRIWERWEDMVFNPDGLMATAAEFTPTSICFS